MRRECRFGWAGHEAALERESEAAGRCCWPRQLQHMPTRRECLAKWETGRVCYSLHCF